MTDDEKPADEYDMVWVTKEMFGDGWHELRNGVVYHHDFSPGDVVRRDECGNYLVRRRKP